MPYDKDLLDLLEATKKVSRPVSETVEERVHKPHQFRQMTYFHGHAIKTFGALDGKRSVEIVARDDGLFHAYEYIIAEALSGDGWAPGRISDLYATVDDAERWAETILRR